MELEEENNYCETIKHFLNFTILLKVPKLDLQHLGHAPVLSLAIILQ